MRISKLICYYFLQGVSLAITVVLLIPHALCELTMASYELIGEGIKNVNQ